jgi:hypothetical protein
MALDDIAGPPALFRALSEGAALPDWPTLLNTMSIGRIEIGQLLSFNPAQQAEIELRGFSVTGFKDGIVQAARFEGMSQRSQSRAGDSVAVEMGETRLEGINVGEIYRFFVGGGSPGNKRLLDRATFGKVRQSGGLETASFERVHLEGIEGRAPTVPISPSQDANSPEGRRRIATYLRDIAGSLRIRRYAIEGFTSAQGGQKTAIQLIAINGLGGRRIDGIEIKGIEAATPEGPGRVGGLDIVGIDYGPLVDFGIEQLEFAQSAPTPSPERIARLIPSIEAIRLQQIDVNTPSGRVSVDGFRYEREGRDTIPRRLTLATTGVTVDVAAMTDQEVRSKLLALGFQTLVSSTQIQLRWQPAEKLLVLDETRMRVEQAGQIEIAARLAQADLAWALANPDRADRALDVAHLESIELRYVDFGALERLYADHAKTSGNPPEAARAELAGKVHAEVMRELRPQLTPGSADELMAFLREPKQLVVRIKPAPGASPLRLSTLKRLDPGNIAAVPIVIEIAKN